MKFGKMSPFIFGLLLFWGQSTHARSNSFKPASAKGFINSAQTLGHQIGKKPNPSVLEEVFSESKVGYAARFHSIAAGVAFDMGRLQEPDCHCEDEAPQHPVWLVDAFEVQWTEVTQGQYTRVMDKNPSKFQTKADCREEEFHPLFGCQHHPVENVSWGDAQEFISRINEFQNTYTYRLLSEAEWEYASWGGVVTSQLYWFGKNENNLLGQFAWHAGNSKGTHPVSTKSSDYFGLYDMYGNVAEWVQDTYHDTYEDAPFDGSAWDDSKIDIHVIRGGSFDDDSSLVRSSVRDFANKGRETIGFRLARTLR
ncbi:MAG: Sulphatase-modifying factor protein [Elusimicrobia bacterium]|nr:MAG: Sulphatase-modifying factor protein [Elusimicrobiota bacterium]